jgi:endogenous inhibitor of DNA gyrase (YacG/DUF329 family)
MKIKKRIVIETLPCPECGSPNRITHAYELLKINGKCNKCQKEVVFTTDRPLRILSAFSKQTESEWFGR